MPAATNRRNIVGINAETVSNVSSTDFPDHWPGEDHSWNIKHFRRTFKVKFYRNTPLLSQFDLIHTDAAIANTLRRIMIAEVPTLAIESVYVSNNTSIIQDEVLAHRLGLIALRGDKDALKGLSWYLRGEDAAPREPTDEDTIVLHLKKSCERNPDGKKTDTDPDKLYINHNVYASDMVFEPAGRQIKSFARDPVRAANPDVLIAKLRPGQEIDLTMHCVKGIGQDHAKFSPVAPASYRLFPDIRIKKPIRGKAAERFAACFPKGVIAVREGRDGEKEAVVDNVRNDTVSREVLRHDEFRGMVELGRVRDHFIFSVESTGQFDADEVFLSAVGTLKAKTINLKRDIYKMLRKQALDAKRAREAENPDADEEGDAMDTQ